MKVVLLVSDLRRSRQFYTGLGFRVVRRHEDGVTIALADNVLELRSDARAAAGPDYFTPEIDRFPRGTGVELAIETADLDALYEVVRGLDVDLVSNLAPGDGPDRAFRVADPDGYCLRFAAPILRT